MGLEGLGFMGSEVWVAVSGMVFRIWGFTVAYEWQRVVVTRFCMDAWVSETNHYEMRCPLTNSALAYQLQCVVFGDVVILSRAPFISTAA